MSERVSVIQGKTPWDFCCQWYQLEEITMGIARHVERHGGVKQEPGDIPMNVASPEFAEWMTHQYRLAMNKGIEAALSEANARLRAREPYVQHLPGCAIHKPYSEMEGEEPNQCDCGFDKLKGG